jgi:hypothetical protein
MELPLLEFYYHGHFAQEREQEIRSTLEECYSHLGRWLPPRVEVQVFETSVELTAFLQNEKTQFGISTLGDDAFICSHDAWQGFPRLMICTERLFALSPLARLGALRHEAAHTVLHGGLAYYVFKVPSNCLQMAQAKGMETTYLQHVLYYCAIAVKDFEAMRLLLHAGYQECQVALAEVQFSTSKDDELAWLLAKDHPQARLFFFTSQLKTILLGWPLEVAKLMQVEAATDSMLNYMEPDQRQLLLRVAISIAKQLGSHTHDNVSLTLRRVLQELQRS